MSDHDNDNLRVFRSFALVCGLAIEIGSIRLGQPPEPDILCRIADEERAFELVRAVNEGVVRQNLDRRRRAEREGAAHDVYTPDPFAFLAQPLRKKAAKRYRAQGPVDLLLWIDRTKDHLPKAVIDAMPKAVIHVLQQHAASWRAVWLFEPATSTVIARAEAGCYRG